MAKQEPTLTNPEPTVTVTEPSPADQAPETSAAMTAEDAVQAETATAAEASEMAEGVESSEAAKTNAEVLRLKLALDKATREAAENKRALRARQSAEEAAAANEKKQIAAIENELKQLRRERAVANASKRVMTFVQDEKTATSIAEALYGAADIDLAVDVLSKAWTMKEKALRTEFGKIPAPGVGDTDGPGISKQKLDAMGYRDRLQYANKHPDEYQKLMGR